MRTSLSVSSFASIASCAPRALAVFASVAIAACGGAATTGVGGDASLDAGPARSDAGADASHADAGKADTGKPDSGKPDAGHGDAGSDTGLHLDAPVDSPIPVDASGHSDAAEDSGTDAGPSCPPFEARCGTGASAFCAEIQIDPKNCGTCGTTCQASTYCSEGSCGATCIGVTSTLCSGTCVDSQSDNKNCGTCGNACPAGQVCSGGACAATCAATWATCGTGTESYCALTQFDPDTCGACGTVCGAAKVCSAGTCQSTCSGATASLCEGLCVDIDTDNANCGACGKSCETGTTCTAGACAAACAPTCPLGNACGGNSDCLSGNCTGGKCAAAVATEQLFTASGMLTVPMGITQVRVVAVGGGGGGGGGHDGQGSAGGGGGGGQVAVGGYTVASGATFVVTVGAGGAGGISSPTATLNMGSSGASSSFGALLSAVGGGGGGGGYNPGNGAPKYFGGAGGGSGGGAGGNGAYSSQGGNGGTGGSSGGSSTLIYMGNPVTANGGLGIAFPVLTTFITQISYSDGAGGVITAPDTTYNGGGGGGGLVLAGGGATAASGGASGTSSGEGGPGGVGFGAGGGGGTGSSGAGGVGNGGAVYVEYCGTGLTACSSGCESLTSDVHNCGGCGKTCAAGQTCDDGFCGVMTSCAAVLAANPAAASGVFTIDPDGSGPNAPFAAYCDMTTDGGGWILMATLHTTNVFTTSNVTADWAGAWTDDWFNVTHGDPTNPMAVFVNREASLFTALITPTTILRANTPANAVARYHFGFKQTDWAQWNAGRTLMGPTAGVDVIGPFDLANVQVSTSVNLTSPVAANINGQWSNGTFYLGTAIQGTDTDDGSHARFHVGSNEAPTYGFAGNAQVDAAWSLWIR